MTSKKEVEATQPGIADWLTYLSIFMLPIISVPLFPSNYRPLSIVFLLPAVVLLVLTSITAKGIGLRREDVWLVGFVSISISISTVKTALIRSQVADAAFESILLLVGALSFFCFRSLIKKIAPEILLKTFVVIGCLMIALGIFELLALYGPISDQLRVDVMESLNGKVSSRVQLTTSEASWAARVTWPILLVLVAYRQQLAAVSGGVLIFLLAAIFIATFSFEGYLTAALTFIFYYAFFPGQFSKRVFLYTGIAVVAFCSSALIVNYSGVLDRTNLPYYASRLTKVSEIRDVSLSSLMMLDESTFIRVNYPLISFEMFLDHPLFGVGNGSYEDEFPKYLGLRGEYPFRSPQIMNDLINGDGDPRNLLGRVLAENGLTGGLVFLAFVASIWRRAARLKSESTAGKLGRLLFAASIAGSVQFGSLVFFQNWFIWAWISAMYGRSRWKVGR